MFCNCQIRSVYLTETSKNLLFLKKLSLYMAWVLTRFLQRPNYRSPCTSRDPYYSHIKKKFSFLKKNAVKNIFVIYIYIYKMYCKSAGDPCDPCDPCDPLSVPRLTTKYAATQFWVATHGLRTQGIWSDIGPDMCLDLIPIQ